MQIYNYSAMGGWRGGKGRLWDSQPFKHPATFDTLALDHHLKAQVGVSLRSFADQPGPSVVHQESQQYDSSTSKAHFTVLLKVIAGCAISNADIFAQHANPLAALLVFMHQNTPITRAAYDEGSLP